MEIKNIKIKNFRNYKELELNFNNKINIFIGNNAQGKTNLIESLYVLGITKSHRTYNEKKLIKEGEDFLKISGIVKNENTKKELEILISSKGKSVKIDKNIIRKTSEYISNLVVVLFCPDDLEIIKGSPSIRRRFLNIELGQIDNNYLVHLNKYNKLLKNRNEYLKQNNERTIEMNFLEVLDKQIAEEATMLYNKRIKFIDELNIYIKKIYKKISNGDIIQIKYETNVDVKQEKLEELILKKLKSNIKKDLLFGTTTIGPHRDDFLFYLNNHKINEYGSQGQQRLAALCLKLAEIEIFIIKNNDYPILLLDDIFSELDEKRRCSVIEYINKGIQTFITATDINDIKKNILKNSDIYDVKEGIITKLK